MRCWVDVCDRTAVLRCKLYWVSTRPACACQTCLRLAAWVGAVDCRVSTVQAVERCVPHVRRASRALPPLRTRRRCCVGVHLHRALHASPAPPRRSVSRVRRAHSPRELAHRACRAQRRRATSAPQRRRRVRAHPVRPVGMEVATRRRRVRRALLPRTVWVAVTCRRARAVESRQAGSASPARRHQAARRVLP